jgi:phosphatidate phosphatase APP1
MTTTTTDGRAFFTSESSGFFAGSTYLSHHQVLQWAKEKDCCDARLVRLATTPQPGLAFPPSTGMVNLVEPTGISIISDIDDTIKETRILHGARTVLANTFFNPSKAIPGMAEAYMKWVNLHALYSPQIN